LVETDPAAWRRATRQVFMLSLKGQWIEATAVGHPDGPVGVKVGIERGMSGSPILDDKGARWQ
jgi:hypothetical protein